MAADGGSSDFGFLTNPLPGGMGTAALGRGRSDPILAFA